MSKSYEDAVRLWAAGLLATKYEVEVDDIDLTTISESIEIDPGWTDPGGSLSESASAGVEIAGRVKDGVTRSYDSTSARARIYRDRPKVLTSKDVMHVTYDMGGLSLTSIIVGVLAAGE